MYIPSIAKPLSDTEQPPLRVAIQGASGSGKTYSAVTFPNPIVADFDGGLTSLKATRPDIVTIPFYSDAFIRSKGVNRRDYFKAFLEQEAVKLTREQTLIVDSWTTLQIAFDIQTEKEPVYTKGGSVDEFAFWGRKKDWSRDICQALLALSCNVVVTFHEQQQRDSAGNPTTKLEPVMQGSWSQQLPIFFSDWFRQSATTERKKLADGTEVAGATLYQWQTKPNSIANCKSRLSNLPALVPAHFDSLKAYYDTKPKA